jgi:hypothetical protein
MHHVKKCDVTECCFNTENKCHAVAIQVGDQVPQCDTYSQKKESCGFKELTADVGACKVTECVHNVDLICTADAIDVSWRHQRPECISFSHR